VVAVTIRSDELGAIGRLAARSQATPTRRPLREACAAGTKRLLEDDPVLRLCGHAFRGSAFLETPDKIIVNVAHQQLAHGLFHGQDFFQIYGALRYHASAYRAGMPHGLTSRA
jgi:hypothetical protein